MTYIILQGLFIGLLSSAPMGPVGMLCVQRTLNDGRPYGLVTGLGAAVGDVIYAIITLIGALGLSFIFEYLERHQPQFQIGGSIILLIFGYFVYRQNPAKSITKLSKDSLPFGKIFMSSLALTLSNVGMLFLYIALFARFNLIDTSLHFGHGFIFVLSIGIGALIWWFFITYIVNKLRAKFNPRGLKLFNRIVGTVLFVIGVVGIISGIYLLASGSGIKII